MFKSLRLLIWDLFSSKPFGHDPRCPDCLAEWRREWRD